MKKYALFFAALFGALNLQSQEAGSPPPPPPRDMRAQEIYIAGTVLEKLIRQEFDRADSFVHLEKIHGTYMPGVGALFNISHAMPFFTQGTNFYGLSKIASTDNARPVARASRPSTTSPVKQVEKPVPGASVVEVEPVVKTIPEYQGQVGYQDQAKSYLVNGQRALFAANSSDDPRVRDSVFEDKLPRLKKVIGEFFGGYAVLLTKLTAEEKIGVNWVFEKQQWGLRPAGPACSLSAAIRKQDILDYRAGKLSAEALEKRIQYHVTRCAQKTVNNTELEVFGAILEKLYSDGITQSLIQLGPVDYDAVQGFGFVVSLNFTEHPNETFGVLSGYKQTPKPAQNSDFQNRLTIFKTQFPEQLIEYGRILKTLKPDEVLQVQVNFPYRWGDEAKPGIVYTIPRAVLAGYDSGKTSLAEAIKSIRVEEKAH